MRVWALPQIKVSRRIAANEIDAEINTGRVDFVLEIPAPRRTC